MAMKTILIVTAEPKRADPLRLNKEISLIQSVFEHKNDSYKVVFKPAATPQTLHDAMVETKPWIVHFSGHGSGEPGLIFEDELGQAKPIGADALADLFQSFETFVECLILNACFSSDQAKGISKHINYVVGMGQEIRDSAALDFSSGFYTAIAGGFSIENSFQQGCSRIHLNQTQPRSEHLIPQLIKRGHSSTPAPRQLLTGPLPIRSPFYIDRPQTEALCYPNISQPGALIRIHSPGRKWGKTSLLSRILHYSKDELGYHAIRFSFNEGNDENYASLRNFLRWFCSSITDELGLEDVVDKHWNSLLSDKQNCSAYFERYLLPQLSRPLVLGLDDMALLFKRLEELKSQDIAKEFFSILRCWHDEGANNPELQKLRLVLVRSLENQVHLPDHQSPFNVGIGISLSEFNLHQAKALSQNYGLDWTLEQLSQLLGLVGGHPHLLQVSFFYIATGTSFRDAIKLLINAQSPIGEYLTDILSRLTINQRSTLKLLTMSDSPMSLDSAQDFLDRGLIRRQGNGYVPFCKLYRSYFQQYL